MTQVKAHGQKGADRGYPLRPSKAEGGGTQDLHNAKVDIAHVVLNRENAKISGGVASGTSTPNEERTAQYRDAQAAAAEAARSLDSTHGATHFYLNYPGEPTPLWARGRIPAATFGPFNNAAGGGDVPRSDPVWIVIIP